MPIPNLSNLSRRELIAECERLARDYRTLERVAVEAVTQVRKAAFLAQLDSDLLNRYARRLWS